MGRGIAIVKIFYILVYLISSSLKYFFCKYAYKNCCSCERFSCFLNAFENG